MRIGAHVKSSGGCHHAFPRAAEIGAEAIQLFVSAPQQWKAPVIAPAAEEAFRSAAAETGLPVFFHGVYLVNLASEDPALTAKSVASLTGYLEWGERLGAVGTIFHVGSHKGAGFEAVLPQVVRLMRQVLDATPPGQKLIMENNAGQGSGIGIRFAELGAILHGLGNDPRVAVCLDTCHAFAMGYDIGRSQGCEQAMAEFDREVGLDRLVAVHANDSKGPLGGVRDRHENIGDGHIGTDGFRTILAHRAFAEVPFLLEVPGLAGEGPDRENVERLKAIRAEVGVPA